MEVVHVPLGSTSRTDVEQSGAAESGVVVPVPPPAATDAAPVAPVGSTTAGTTDVGGEPASSNPLDQLSEAHLARLGVCDGPGGGTDGGGVSFCHLNSAEAELIWEEVWVRRTYLQHGVSLRSGDTVVDVGANIGLFSLLALSYGATVVAVEPIPALAAVLEANLNRWAQSSPGGAAITEPQRGSRRGLGGRLAPAPPPPIRNYHVVQAAIGATVEDAARFSFYPEYPGESTRNPEERTAQRGRLLQELRALPLPDQGVPDEMAVLVRTELSKFDGESEDGPMVEHVLCPVRPLGAVLATCGLDEAAIDLLKVDAEGDELTVLEGLTEGDWRRTRQIVLEVHDTDKRLLRTTALLESHGFDVTVVQQTTEVVDGYLTFLPAALSLHYVYATRPTRATTTTEPQPKRTKLQ